MGGAPRTWRVEQEDLNLEYLSSDFCSLTSGRSLRAAGCELRGTDCGLRAFGMSIGECRMEEVAPLHFFIDCCRDHRTLITSMY